jgi:hypothetical protein
MSLNNMLDYYKNPTILAAINTNIRHIKNRHDREDCKQEIFAELYDFMPLNEEEAIRLINRTASKFKYAEKLLNEKEISLKEAGIQ